MDSIGISYVNTIGQSYAPDEHCSVVAKIHKTGFWGRLVEALNDYGIYENYQTEVAKLIGIKQPSVAEWESGETMPSMANVVKLAGKINADVQYLYLDKRNKYSIPRRDKEAIELWSLWHLLSPATRGRLLGIAQESIRQAPPSGGSEQLHRSSG